MQVMFVDDESRVLSGIERALMLQDTEWECRFATSGQEALAMLEEEAGRRGGVRHAHAAHGRR
ncbi:hypothetical protein [Sodalis sp. RH19]|uniref:hypothetical protein n=1 Tax=Sodalis sp. RH19 TaxID=3394334 RepID=UPI0039B6D604